MRLLLVTGAFPARSETFIYRKVAALARRGHAVTVATRRVGDWAMYPEPLPPSVRVMEMLPDNSLRDPRRVVSLLGGGSQRFASNPSAARALYRATREDSRTQANAWRQFIRHLSLVGERPDVVHFEFLSLGAMYPLARDVVRAPLIVSCRGNDLHTLELRGAAEHDAAVECLRRADAVHCVSDEMAREVARISGRTDGVWVNRPAVEVERIVPRTTMPAGRVRLLATGRLIWKKGFDYLLAALARLVAHGLDFEAEIVGEGELYSVLRYSIEDLGLARHVRLAGALSSAEVLARMQSTDIFVLSSVEEGISNAVLEAMATGIPIVTTTAGGMGEAVTDGVEGFVVPVRDAAALASRLETLIEDAALRARMAKAARLRAETEFSIERQATVFESIYRSVIA